MKRIACFLFLAALFSYASCQKPVVLKNQTFSAQETADWELFLQRFDEAICEIENKRNRAACWQSFFERMREQAREGDLSVKIPEEKHAYILSALSPELQDDTWETVESYPQTLNTVTGDRTRDTVSHLALKQEKYYRFLVNEVKPLSPRTEFYVSAWQEVNDV